MEEDKYHEASDPREMVNDESETHSQSSQQNEEEREAKALLNQIPPNFEIARLHGQASKV